MAKQPTRIRAREVEVERLVIREPGGGRVRVVIETVAEKRGRAATVRFSMLAPDGTPALVVDIDGDGAARVTVGDRDAGDALLITRQSAELWAGGNAVVAAWSHKGAGHIEILDRAGMPAFTAPAEPGP